MWHQLVASPRTSTSSTKCEIQMFFNCSKTKSAQLASCCYWKKGEILVSRDKASNLQSVEITNSHAAGLILTRSLPPIILISISEGSWRACKHTFRIELEVQCSEPGNRNLLTTTVKTSCSGVRQVPFMSTQRDFRARPEWIDVFNVLLHLHPSHPGCSIVEFNRVASLPSIRKFLCIRWLDKLSISTARFQKTLQISSAALQLHLNPSRLSRLAIRQWVQPRSFMLHHSALRLYHLPRPRIKLVFSLVHREQLMHSIRHR